MQAYQDKTAVFYNVNAEREIIGCFLNNTRALKHVPELSSDDFTNEEMRVAFTGIQRLSIEKKPVDIVMLDDKLMQMGHPSMLTTLIDCTTTNISAGYVEEYITIVKDLSTRRKVRTIAEQTLDAICDPAMDTPVVIERSRQALREITQTRHSWVDMATLMLNTYMHMDRVQKGEIRPVTSGLKFIDALIGGFFAGELTVIGARPGVGKSALALNIALGAAKAGKCVGFVSIEMSEQQFGQRMYSRGSHIDGMKIRTGQLKESDWLILAETMQLFSDLPVWYVFSMRYIEDIITEAQRKYDMGQLDMLIIDYLQLAETKQRLESERVKVSHISKRIKQLSKDLNIPVIALAQLRRMQVQRNDGQIINPVPSMQDLKESGNIEQDADNIILMHRPEHAADAGIENRDREYFDALTANDREYIAINVAKQRQGRTGIITTIFDPSVMQYRRIDRGSAICNTQ